MITYEKKNVVFEFRIYPKLKINQKKYIQYEMNTIFLFISLAKYSAFLMIHMGVY